jgi:hypothetical protein
MKPWQDFLQWQRFLPMEGEEITFGDRSLLDSLTLSLVATVVI